MPEQTIHLNPRRFAVRLLLIFVLALTLVWAFFVVRWYLGNTLAEYFNADDRGLEMAQLAVSIAPSDPLTHWRLGDVTARKLPSDQIGQVVAAYEKAASLSPNDYRFWMAFGSALEQSGDISRGEKALRRAVELAPSYALPRWYLGNLLLRSESYEAAFAELQSASDADPELRGQLFNLAWRVFGDDEPQSLRAAVGQSTQTRAQFALYLLERERFDDGLNLWASLSEAEKLVNSSTGRQIIETLVAARRFRQAMDVWNQIAPNEHSQAQLDQLLDGSFETGISHSEGAVFSWQVQSQQQAQVAIDPGVGRSGSRSLRLVFQVRTTLAEVNVSQLVPVRPNFQYELSYFLKTQKLESAGTPVWTIFDAADNVALAVSEAAPTGINDWQRVGLSFKTGAKTEAIILRMTRSACGEDGVCPMFGTIWYDDFFLKRTN